MDQTWLMSYFITFLPHVIGHSGSCRCRDLSFEGLLSLKSSPVSSFPSALWEIRTSLPLLPSPLLLLLCACRSSVAPYQSPPAERRGRKLDFTDSSNYRPRLCFSLYLPFSLSLPLFLWLPSHLRESRRREWIMREGENPNGLFLSGGRV